MPGSAKQILNIQTCYYVLLSANKNNNLYDIQCLLPASPAQRGAGWCGPPCHNKTNSREYQEFTNYYPSEGFNLTHFLRLFHLLDLQKN